LKRGASPFSNTLCNMYCYEKAVIPAISVNVPFRKTKKHSYFPKCLGRIGQRYPFHRKIEKFIASWLKSVLME
jgi:hypothetical protein